jgi:glycosyltransferase involved in cell wall biosynthesis
VYECNSKRAMPTTIVIDVVICTFNRAAYLDNVLLALSVQRICSSIDWSVLVVDNASMDQTAEVVEAHRLREQLPGLRRVLEGEQGLTPARRRGVRETSAPWIAFIDDDNLLEPCWLDAIAEGIRAHPEAGGFGGRVTLEWEEPPPSVFRHFGWCFAEQHHGEAPCEIHNLVGAGMVVRRSALAECGWLERTLLADRVGKRVVSGGDVEIAQRVRSAGYPLWFIPDAVLRHRISGRRTNWRYLFRVLHGLGASGALVGALCWPGDWASWRRMAFWRSLKGLGDVFTRRGGGVVGRLAWLCHEFGFIRGVCACIAMAPKDRNALLGMARVRRPFQQSPGRGDGD